jgi:phospholipase C
LAGVRGFDGPDALKLPNGQPVFYQPDAENPNGYLLPFHLDTNASSAQKIPSTCVDRAARSVERRQNGSLPGPAMGFL